VRARHRKGDGNQYSDEERQSVTPDIHRLGLAFFAPTAGDRQVLRNGLLISGEQANI